MSTLKRHYGLVGWMVATLLTVMLLASLTSAAPSHTTVDMSADQRLILICEGAFIEHERQLDPGRYDVACEPVVTPTETATLEPTATFTPEPPTATATSEPIMGYHVVYSTSSDRVSAQPLDGATVSGIIYVFVLPEENINNVDFFLDDVFVRNESGAPYDLMGTVNGAAEPLDTATLADGSHAVRSETKEVSVPDRHMYEATFTVANEGGTPPTATPTEEPSPTATEGPMPTPTNTPEPTATPEPGDLTLTSTFRSISVYLPGGGSTVEYRTGGGAWIQGHPLSIDPETSEARGSLVGLDPDTIYEVRVSGEVAMISTRTEVIPLGNGATHTVSTAAGLQAALTSAGAGDTIVLTPGTYVGPFTLTADGSTDNYISIIGDGTGEAVLSGNAGAVSTVLELDDADYVRVAGLTIRDADGSLIKLLNGSDYAVIEDNTLIEPAYDRTASVSDTSATVHMRQDSSHAVIRNNVMHRETVMMTKIGVPATFGWKAGKGTVIYGNTVTGGFEDAFRWAPEDSTSENRAIDLDIYDNVIDGACYDDAIQPEGVGINVRIWGNTIRHCFVAMAFAPTIEGPVYVFRNVVYDNVHSERGGSALYKLGDEDEGRRGAKFFYHNTFYANSPATTVTGYKQTNSGLGGIISRNNIVHTGRYVYEGGCDPCSLDYDAVYTIDPSRFVEYRGPRYSDIDEWCSEAGQECNGIERDASADFVDAARGNFNLIDSSPLIDAGVVIPGFNDGYLGVAPDIGANEMR